MTRSSWTSIAVVTLAMLVLVDGQFMLYRIQRNRERKGQKLIEHVMELDLPVVPQQQAPSINRREMDTTNDPSLIQSAVHDFRANLIEGNCDPNSNKYSYELGYTCTCKRAAINEKITCTKQYNSISLYKMGRNDPNLLMLMINFEKLVAKSSSRSQPRDRTDQEK